MLTERRHALILDTLKRKHSVDLNELCTLLETSESTVRRDLTILAQSGMLTKVRGGAIEVNEDFSPLEHTVEEKANMFVGEKTAIARYAASLIEDGDFIYLDAGTTTEKMIDFIPSKSVTFVTNAFANAKRLAQRGLRVLIPAGEIKASTEAVVGAEAVISISRYHFTKCFMGTNGISLSGGFTTPDINEAGVKTAAIDHSRQAYILADHSKFDRVTAISFAQLHRAEIITDRLEDQKYFSKASIKEVLI